MWLIIKRSKSQSDINFFLSSYPNGRFKKHAELLLKQIEKQELALSNTKNDIAPLVKDISHISHMLKRNLIKNPGAEDGINFWQTNTSTYTARKQRSENDTPKSGTFYFFPGPYKGTAVANQVIDLSHITEYTKTKNLKYVIKGYMRDFEGSEKNRNGGDISQIKVEFLNNRNEVLKIVKSDEISTSDYWVEFEDEGIIPYQTAKVRFNLVSTYRWGSNNNDGYFDDLYFGLKIDQIR
jgi:hypothetical protein